MDYRALVNKLESINEAAMSSQEIADKIKTAVTGLGTDEEAVYAALAAVTGPKQWLEIRGLYPNVDADLLDDFSDWFTPELTKVKTLLKNKGIDLAGKIVIPAEEPAPVDNSAAMAKLKKLEELVDQYLALKAKLKPAVKESLEQQLLESFGYTKEELDEAAWWDATKQAAGKVAAKVALPVNAALTIYEAWDALTHLPPNMTPEQTKIEVTKVLTKLVADFGLFWVGSIIGGAIAGAITGPGAVAGFIVGGVGGGIAASYLLGDKLDIIIDKAVEYLMKNKTPAAAPATQPGAKPAAQPGAKPAGAPSAAADQNISKLQQLLKGQGYDLGTFGPNGDGVDGVLGTKTVTALQQDLVKAGAKIQVTGKLDQPTLGAMDQYYLKAAGA